MEEHHAKAYYRQLRRLPHRLILAVGALLLATSGWAQVQDKYDLGSGFLVGAAVEATAVYRDNFFYEDADGVSASGYRLRPSAGVTRNSSAGRFSLDANLEQSNFDLPGKLDSYLDYNLNSGYVWLPFTRHRFDLEGGFRRGHDGAGLQRTESGANFARGKIDRWNQTGGSLTYRYGAADSLAGSTLRIDQIDRHYVTNRSQTRFLDFTSSAISYELAYEYSPKTAVLFSVSQRATDYAQSVLANLGNRNGNEFAARFGVRWAATAKTSGDVQVGVRDYSVDGRARPSRQALSWKANITWQPNPLTEFKLVTGETTIETFRADTFFIDERNVSLDWRQTWSQRLSTKAGARYASSDFVGSQRKDDYLSGYLGLDYRLARQVTIFGQYTSRNRDSNLRLLDYNAPESILGLRWNL